MNIVFSVSDPYSISPYMVEECLAKEFKVEHCVDEHYEHILVLALKYKIKEKSK